MLDCMLLDHPLTILQAPGLPVRLQKSRRDFSRTGHLNGQLGYIRVIPSGYVKIVIEHGYL